MNPQASIEQKLLHLALGTLTSQQKKVWEMYNYDRMTQKEIASVLSIKRQNVDLQLKAIARKVKKWCELNRGAYLLLKIEHQVENENE